MIKYFLEKENKIQYMTVTVSYSHRRKISWKHNKMASEETSGEKTEYFKIFPYAFLIQFFHIEGLLL